MGLFALTTHVASSFRWLLLVFALCTAPVAGAQPGAADDDGILLWRVVPSDLYAPGFPAETFNALLAKSLPRSVDVKPNDTLSAIVQRHFNASRSWTPAVYDALVEQIKLANRLANDTDLKPGPLTVPDLPRTGKSQPSASNLLNALPKISTLDLGAKAWDSSKKALVGTPIVSDAGRLGSNLVMQIREVPMAEAQAYAAPADEDVPTQFRYAALRVPLTAELSAEAAAAPTANTCPPLESALAAVLSGTPRTQATVVVLDDAWPDNSEFLKARDFVVNASKLIRAQFKLDGATPMTGDIDALKNMTSTSFPSGIAPYPAVQTHAAAIKTSLRDFSCNDRGRGVNVIYLPMGSAQDGAQPLLREILYLAYLARIKSNNFSADLVWAPPLKDHVDIARSFAAKAFAAEKGKISPFLSPFKPGASSSLVTDQALIEQLAFFLRLYSDATQSPHFLSMSWTARELAWQIYFPEYSYGLMLAAAGNTETVNVHEKRVQFAYRSTNPGDVIAVENSDSANYLCSSSRFTQAEDVDVLGVGYPGEIADTKLCGSSFSTPRVAWLLAAREAYVASPPAEKERSLWQARQKTRIKNLRTSTAQNSMRFHVTWQKLLGLPAN